MQLHYKALKKAPLLLPLFWTVRGVRTLLCTPKKLYSRLRGVCELNAAAADDHRAALAFVGFADDGGAEHG